MDSKHSIKTVEDAIDRLRNNFAKYMTELSFFSKDCKDDFNKMCSNRDTIQTILKPISSDISGFVRSKLIQHKVKESCFLKDQWQKFIRYLEAMCELY